MARKKLFLSFSEILKLSVLRKSTFLASRYYYILYVLIIDCKSDFDLRYVFGGIYDDLYTVYITHYYYYLFFSFTIIIVVQTTLTCLSCNMKKKMINLLTAKLVKTYFATHIPLYYRVTSWLKSNTMIGQINTFIVIMIQRKKTIHQFRYQIGIFIRK